MRAAAKIYVAGHRGMVGSAIEMVREDLKVAERDELIKHHGFKTMDHHE